MGKWIVYFSSNRPLYLEQVSFLTTTSTINKIKGYLIKYENKQQFMQPRSQGSLLPYPLAP